MQEQIRISLLGRSQRAVALDVGHSAVNSKVLVLYAGEELEEVLVVLGAACLVDLVGGGENSVHSVHAYAALEACCGLLAEQTLHLDLLDQVIGRLMHVGEAVDLLAGDVGGSGHQIFILRILSQLIGSGKGVQRRTDNRVINRVLDLFAEHVKVQMQLAKRLNILLFGHHSVWYPFFFGFRCSRYGRTGQERSL